ncbi:MAG TPA: hypothetical protein VFV00_15680 [Acidimicrobiales bacterium]|nr:hypothetical protein [Acidimicrobiales bacterium]
MAVSTKDMRLAPNAAPTQWHDDAPQTPLSAWILRAFAVRAWPNITPNDRGTERRAARRPQRAATHMPLVDDLGPTR